jgi:hypothetical protein
MIALALFEGATVIDLWGCNADPANDDGIVPKRPAVDFWIGFAMGMDKSIYINGKSIDFSGVNKYGY